MYYETKQGDDELRASYLSNKEKFNEQHDTSDDDSESQTTKPKKRRRNEVSKAEHDSKITQRYNNRPKRAAAMRVNEEISGQSKIDRFISKKRSPTKTVKSPKTNSILPPLPVNDSERCPICDRLIANDILEIHTNACLINNSDAGKELLEKSKQRAKTEAKAKEILFQRTTRHSLAVHLARKNSETTTCPICGMQMTLFRLENQHKNECSYRPS